MKQNMNVLLVVCDQFRGDALSFANHPDVKTPYLDSLAADGVFFSHAYSATPSCIPARAALMTGRSQERHGRVGYLDEVEWRYQHYMAEEFSNNGYQTQCIGKMHVHPPRLTCGFQGLQLHDGYLGCYRNLHIPHWMHQDVSDDYLQELRNALGEDADINASGAECNSWVTHPWIYEERLHPTNWVADKSIRFLKTRDRTRPFFLMSSFVRPHQPLDPPKAYFDMYKDKDLRSPASGDWDCQNGNGLAGRISDSIYGCCDAAMRKDAMAGYYAAITHVDHQLGRILTALKEDGSYDNTIILFTSDHGEMLFDHSLWRKVFPYEGSIHIPFLLHIGKNIADIVPHTVNGITELRDVMPTLLDLCNLPIPETVDGSSLKRCILQEAEAVRSYLHGEHSFHDKLSNHYIVTEQDKFIWYSETGEEQYFDLRQDPQETHNAIQDVEYQTRIAQLRDILIQKLQDREEGYSDGTRLICSKPQDLLQNVHDY